MNQVETWFSILQRQAIQRGVFGSVRALMPAEVLRRPNMKVNSRARH
jgi:hypothetical protein